MSDDEDGFYALLGDGAGSFGALVQTAAGTDPGTLAVADFAGDGTFGGPTPLPFTLPSSFDTARVFPADMDGDGIPDQLGLTSRGASGMTTFGTLRPILNLLGE